MRVVRAERGGRERKGVASHFLSEGVFRGDDVAARIHPSARFVIPPELGYGRRGYGSKVGSKATVVFLVQMLE